MTPKHLIWRAFIPRATGALQQRDMNGMTKERAIAWSFTALLLLGVAGASAAETEVPGWIQSAQEIAPLVEGRTHYREREDGASEIEFHSMDGRVAYQFDGCMIAGRWWLEENVLCYAYPSMTGEMAHCFWLRMNRGQLEYWSTEEPQEGAPVATTFDNLAGNPEHLALDADGQCQEI